jgi:hypothetical protein
MAKMSNNATKVSPVIKKNMPQKPGMIRSFNEVYFNIYGGMAMSIAKPKNQNSTL